jgi:glycosyltransferase involved in cell wall biosynthesis
VRIAFLTQDLYLSGGVGVVVGHGAQLARHGFEVDLVLTQTTDAPQWSYRGLEQLHTLPFELARTRRYDIAVATWWETVLNLFDLDAERYVWFVQSLEDRFYPEDDWHRVAARLMLGTPVRFVTEARWIAATLEALSPGEEVLYVRNGVAKDVFEPLERVPAAHCGPLRVLIEGSLTVPFKGVADALAAVGAMREARHVTLLAPDGSAAGVAGVDRALGPVPQAELAEIYANTEVLLKLSRVEGMSGPPLEAFHKGAACVTTPVTGHDEYVVHGENALVVDWDDTAGTARALDLLARDRALLQRLRAGALATARAWPSIEQQGEAMAAALRTIASQSPPDGRRVGQRQARSLTAALSHSERVAMELEGTRRALQRLRAAPGYRLEDKARTTARRVVRAPRRLLGGR